MNRLLTALKWDFIRQQRYQIVTAALLITILYIMLFLGIRWEYEDKLLIFLLFNDPAGLGMLFIGSLILFEKSDRTLEALVVTPIKPWQYLWSKALSLTLITTLCTYAIAFAGHGWSFNYLYFSTSIVLTALLFTFFGVMIVAGCQSFNEYIMKMGLSLIPVAFPFLNFLHITDTYWWYLVPSQASLILMEAAFGEATATWEIIYSFAYLILATGIFYYFAQRAFLKKLQNL